jgi:hypothetical protein
LNGRITTTVASSRGFVSAVDGSPSGSSQCEPSGRVVAFFASVMHKSDEPPMPMPTMVGGQGLGWQSGPRQ